jgi:hypothetical protein
MSNKPKATPKYNSPNSKSIITPDVVKTRIGRLKFFDGLPSKKTAKKIFDNLDFLRGVEVFLNGNPAASLEWDGIAQARLNPYNLRRFVPDFFCQEGTL